jgi:PAS domain S-box-containing protein
MHERQRFTELRETQEALRASEQRWRNLTEALPQLVWSAMPDGACDYFSAQWTEHTGVLEPDLLGWRWLETLHPDDREPTRKFWLDSVAERHPYDIEYRVRRRDGEYRWFKTRGVPIRDSNGAIIGGSAPARTSRTFGRRRTRCGGKAGARQPGSLMGTFQDWPSGPLARRSLDRPFLGKAAQTGPATPPSSSLPAGSTTPASCCPRTGRRPGAVCNALRERRRGCAGRAPHSAPGRLHPVDLGARGHGVFARTAPTLHWF